METLRDGFSASARIRLKMIRSIYEFAFIHCYLWSRRVNGDDYFNVASASMILALLIAINSGSLGAILYLLTGASVYGSSNWAKSLFVGAMLVVAVANYVYFARNDRYLRIIEDSNSSSLLLHKNRFVFLSLSLGSLLLLFLLWFVVLLR